MRHEGQQNTAIFRKSYQPTEVIDGAANFLGLEQKKDVLEISCQLNIPYIPNLFQSLPAKELYKLQHSKTYQELQEQISDETLAKEKASL